MNPKRKRFSYLLRFLHKKVTFYSQMGNNLKNRYTYASDLYHDIRHGGTRSDQIDGDVVMRVGLPMFVELMKKLGIEELTVSGTGLWYGIYSQNLYN